MIQSMTGYGKAVAEIGEKKIIVEIKSLNSKAMDLSTRITPLFKEKELEIRSIVTTVLERGKVDLCIYQDSGNSTNAQSTLSMLINGDTRFKSRGKEQHLAAPLASPRIM